MTAYFNINYTGRSRTRMSNLMNLVRSDSVLWIGAGSGADCHEVATNHPNVEFHALEIDPSTEMHTLRKLRNLVFELKSAEEFLHELNKSPRHFTHVYTGAYSGPAFYDTVWTIALVCQCDHIVTFDRIIKHVGLGNAALAKFPKTTVEYEGGMCSRTFRNVYINEAVRNIAMEKISTPKLVCNLFFIHRMHGTTIREIHEATLPVGCISVDYVPKQHREQFFDCIYRKRGKEGELYYPNEDMTEPAIYKKGRLHVHNGSKFEPAKYRTAKGHMQVLWSPWTPLILERMYECLSEVYVKRADALIVSSHKGVQMHRLDPKRTYKFQPGIVISLPRSKSARLNIDTMHCGTTVDRGKSTVLY